MALSDYISNNVKRIIRTRWIPRKGRTVPSTKDVTLAGGAVELDATFLYADLADSSKMAKELDRRIAAKIMKAFLSSSCRLITTLGGVIQSFDGDRVMGIFIGKGKNTKAAKCALQINYVIRKILRAEFERQYESVRDATFAIRHCVGIDTGIVLAVRAGIRGSNDLIWIGRPPNLAAKLSDLRESPYHAYITARIYNNMNNSAKYGGENNKNMWQERSLSYLGDSVIVYRSKWTWKP